MLSGMLVATKPQVNVKLSVSMSVMMMKRVLSSKVSHGYQDTLNLPNPHLMQMRPPPHVPLPSLNTHRSPADAAATENDLYALQQSRKTSTSLFILHDGPPYANGKPHMGHALNKILKDIVVRHKIITGHSVSFIPGWDTHGLPIEQKALENVKERDSLTPMEIRQKATLVALNAIEYQRDEFRSWGVLADWRHPYLTMDPRYEATQIGVFARMVEEGLIFRDFKPVYWSPSSRTALAEAELEYVDDHKSRSVYVKFQLTEKVRVGAESVDASLLIWTTTPWTLPANQAISLNEKVEYALAKISGELGYYVMAASLVPALAEKLGREIEICERLAGADFKGKQYLHPLTGVQHPVLFGDFVTTDAGTGLVHTAPAHGLDDYKVCRKEGIAIMSLVDERGSFLPAAGPHLAGKFVLDQGSSKVIEMLLEKGALLKEEIYTHRYPYDWRTKKPVILRATEQWFASLSGISEKAIESLEGVTTIPPAGKNRLRGTIASRPDWCISRQRVWGVPIPVFYDETGKPLLSKASVTHIQGLFEKHGSNCWWTLPEEDLLAPAYRAEAGRYRKGQDTMDVWFDSGTSWAHLEQRLASAGKKDLTRTKTLYLEGSDQHRGWFQSSLLTSIAVRGKSPFDVLLTHGFVLDEHGRKMSKSLGNIIEPSTVIRGGKDKTKQPAYGVDVLRMWVSATDYTSDISIGSTILGKVAESQRKIRNTLRFALTNLGDFDPANATPLQNLTPLDKYMVTLLARFAQGISGAYEEFNFQHVARESTHLASVDLSSFYFDIVKDVLYADQGDSPERKSSLRTLALIAEVLVKAMAPITPHLSEEVFENGKKFFVSQNSSSAAPSVFLAGWMPDLPTFPAEFDDITHLRQLKLYVNQAVEDLRASGTINMASESSVTVTLPAGAAVIRPLKNYARPEAFFKVSSFEWRVAEPSAGGEGAAHPQISVTKTDRAKCLRCWNYSVEPQQADPKGECLCPRCLTALQSRARAH